MKTYRVECEWDNTGWWVVTVPEVTGAVTQCKRLDKVPDDVGEALELLTGKKPGFSYWFAIIMLTVIIKLATTPLTKAQFKSMKEMQVIAPLIKEIQAKHKGDQKVIGEKTMELYKEHKINPFASCLPLLVQMPIS